MPRRDRNGHGTGAGRFCDDDLFVHVLAIPGGKIYEYAPAYSIMSVYGSLIRAIVA